MTSLRVLTGASAILCAAHVAPDGRMHGHTWTVTAWTTGRPCALEWQAQLSAWIAKFDHGTLPPNMSRAEAIGEQCLMALNAERVEVRREAERIYAIVERIAA